MGNSCKGKKSTSKEDFSSLPTKKLNENQISILLANTNYDRSEILEWHTQFLVK